MPNEKDRLMPPEFMALVDRVRAEKTAALRAASADGIPVDEYQSIDTTSAIVYGYGARCGKHGDADAAIIWLENVITAAMAELDEYGMEIAAVQFTRAWDQPSPKQNTAIGLLVQFHDALEAGAEVARSAAVASEALVQTAGAEGVAERLAAALSAWEAAMTPILALMDKVPGVRTAE